ncbi:hypothetical protein KKI24_23780 [bacterium]|nr:hypothetical protein [bacterium]
MKSNIEGIFSENYSTAASGFLHNNDISALRKLIEKLVFVEGYTYAAIFELVSESGDYTRESFDQLMKEINIS